LGIKSLVSRRTIDRALNGHVIPSIETVMAFCIALELGAVFGNQLLESAGYRLTASRIHCAYQVLLDIYSGKSIYECNEFLSANGLALFREIA